MRKVKIITSAILLALLITCRYYKDDIGKNVWLYSSEFGGRIFTGLVYDFKSNPQIAHSLIIDFDSSIVIEKKGNIIYTNNDTLAEIIWNNNTCLLLKSIYNDSLVFHKVPSLNNSDSLEYVFNFLTSNIIIYEDNNFNLRIHYDTTFYSYGYRSLNYKEVNCTHIDNSFMFATWNLKEINNSLILFNVDPYSLFPNSLLITKISKDCIVAKKLRVPLETIEEINKFNENVKNKIPNEFEYENCTLTKLENLSAEEMINLQRKLCSKKWKAKQIEKNNTERIGMFRWESSEINRFYPMNSLDITYSFYENGSYEFVLNEKEYSGNYRLSSDGKYIELIDNSIFDSFIEIVELNDNILKTKQLAKVFDSGRKYNIYQYYIEFE
jgi:hypothetical protein